MKIDDLNKSITEMSDDELRELIMNNRKNRRQKPQPKKKSNKTNSLVKNLTEEERLKLIKELEDGI